MNGTQMFGEDELMEFVCELQKWTENRETLY